MYSKKKKVTCLKSPFFRSDGAVDIVVQGDYTTYLLDLATKRWRIARHPEVANEEYASSLQQGKDTVYVIGGYTGDYLNTVFRYLPDEEQWEEMEVTIKLPRRSAVAISIPDDTVNC